MPDATMTMVSRAQNAEAPCSALQSALAVCVKQRFAPADGKRNRLPMWTWQFRNRLLQFHLNPSCCWCVGCRFRLIQVKSCIEESRARILMAESSRLSSRLQHLQFGMTRLMHILYHILYRAALIAQGCTTTAQTALYALWIRIYHTDIAGFHFFKALDYALRHLLCCSLSADSVTYVHRLLGGNHIQQNPQRVQFLLAVFSLNGHW